MIKRKHVFLSITFFLSMVGLLSHPLQVEGFPSYAARKKKGKAVQKAPAKTTTIRRVVVPKRQDGWVSVKAVQIKTFSNKSHSSLKNPHKKTAMSPHPMGMRKRKAPARAKNESMVQKQRAMMMRLSSRQKQRYEKLTMKIIAPCCWTQPVAGHPSQITDQIKLDLMRRLLAGHTDKQIIAFYVKRFGERILSVPEKSYIFLIPLFVSLLALIFVVVLIFRWSRRPKTPAKA